MKLTDSKVRGLSNPGEYRDSVVEGFGVRVYKSGRKAWFLRYQIGGERSRMVLGKYPAVKLVHARDLARDELKRAKGLQRIPEKLTLPELFERYIEQAKKTKKTWREDVRIFNHDLLPVFGGREAARISRGEWRAFFHETASRAPAMALQQLALVRRLYNWAMEWDLVEFNPCHGIRRPVAPKAGQRVLTGKEIAALVVECRRRRRSTGVDLFQFLVFTGQRPEDAKGMRRGHVDGDWWDLPTSKNKRPHRVYLASPVQELLERRPQKGQLFEFVSYNQQRYRVEKEVGFKFTMWDIRRTFVTGCKALGCDDALVSSLVNHTPQGVTRTHYDRYERLPEKQEAWQAWADHVEALIALNER